MRRWSVVGAIVLVVVQACGDRSLSSGAESTTARDTATASTDDANVTTSSSGEPATTGGSTGQDPALCLPEISFGPFEVLLAEEIGTIQRYDVDGDGVQDLYASDGTVIYVRDSGFEVQTLGDMGGLSRIGQFDGEAGLDLVAPTSYRINFFPNLVIENPTAWTVVSDVHGIDVADTNLDGTDDLLLTRQNGERVQLWLGTGDGLFEVSHEFEAFSGAAAKFARVVPDRLDVVLADGADVVQYIQGEAGAFVEAARTQGHSSGALAVASSPAGDWVATSWWWSQLDTFSGAAVFTFPELGEAVALGYELSPELTAGVAGSDVDADGVPELFVEVDNAGGRTSHLDVACKSGDALLLCGRTDLPGKFGRLEVVERGGQPYVLYSSTAGGTTVAAVEVVRCP